MKFLHVIDTLDPEYGGTTAAVLNLSAGLAAIGYENDIVSLDDPKAPWLKELDTCIPVGPSKFGRYHYTSKLVPTLRRLAPHYDAVIVHGVWTYSSLGTWRALAGSGIPYFIFPHGMLDPWFKDHHRLKHLKKAAYWAVAEHRIFRDAASILYTAEDERRLSRKTFSPYKARDEIVIGLGIQTPPRSPLSQPESFYAEHTHFRGKRALIFLGRLHQKKGADLIIEALGRSQGGDSSTAVFFVGPDKDCLWPDLERRARTLGVADRVEWIGMLQGDMKWAALRAASALILPSHQENFGIVVAEALACGTPVLISSKVNIWREIEADGVGFVEDDTIAGTCSLIERFEALSSAELSNMRQAANETYHRRYEAHAAAESFIGALQRRISKT